jgi:hypothetical protein
MRPIDWIFMTLIGGTGLALAVLGLVVWSESRWMSVVMIAVGGGVVFLASFVGPEEQRETKRLQDLCESQGNYWHDPPRADGICLSDAAVIEESEANS